MVAPLQVAVLGAGQMGSGIIELLLQKHGIELAGVYGRRAQRAGIDVGDALGLGTAIGVRITHDLPGMLASAQPHMAIQATCSTVAQAVDKKPSVPIGQTSEDAFGETHLCVDKGLMDQAMVNIGREDVDANGIRPLDPRLSIVGASSDHLILDVTSAKGRIRVGDDIAFSLNYSALLAAMTSPYVAKYPTS